MKSIIFGICIVGMVLFSTTSRAQIIAIQSGSKVSVRNISGDLISANYYTGLKETAQGGNIVVLWYETGKIEIRNSQLNLLSSAYYNDLKKVDTAQDFVVLYYKNGKIEVRNKELKQISSWYL